MAAKKRKQERRVGRVKFPEDWEYQDLFVFCIARIQANIAEAAASETEGKRISLLATTPEGVKYPDEKTAERLVIALTAYMAKYLQDHPLDYSFEFWKESTTPQMLRYKVMLRYSSKTLI